MTSFKSLPPQNVHFANFFFFIMNLCFYIIGSYGLMLMKRILSLSLGFSYLIISRLSYMLTSLVLKEIDFLTSCFVPMTMLSETWLVRR